MKKTQWKKKIKAATEEAGTYKKYFDPVIDTLAHTMEMRDNAIENFDGETMIEYQNKFGAINLVKNPALVVIMELNRDALAYWRDLGLTPSGLKKINDKALDPEKADAFTAAMAKLGI